MAEQAAEANARISALEAERDGAVAALEAATAELATLRVSSSAAGQDNDELVALRAALSVMETELSAARASVDEARAAHQAELAAHKEHSAAHLAATVDAANVEISRVRTEAQGVHASASQAVADLQARLAAALAEHQALVDAQKGHAPGALGNGHGGNAEATALATRIAELEARLAQVDPAMMATVRSLVEAVDPLRWGLGAAIDYLDPFEGNDASLAGHVRNLRLLQATLARLVAESAKA